MASAMESRLSVINLYRRVMRAMPAVKIAYKFELPADTMKLRMADKFRANAGMKDPRAIAWTITKGEKDYEEVMTQFKQKSQINRFFDMDRNIREEKKQSSFLGAFYAGN